MPSREKQAMPRFLRAAGLVITSLPGGGGHASNSMGLFHQWACNNYEMATVGLEGEAPVGRPMSHSSYFFGFNKCKF